MCIYPCWSTIAFGVWSVENSSWSLASVHTTMTVNGQLHSPFRYQNVQLLRRLSKTKQRSEDISSSQQSQFTVFNYEEDQTDCTWHCWELTDVFEKKKKWKSAKRFPVVYYIVNKMKFQEHSQRRTGNYPTFSKLLSTYVPVHTYNQIYLM